ncbi:DUF2878 domain-containing protein [Pseudoalteromonas luteoviolacea]|uniref:DUF2878 domain-containing protein n=1 Tax=Pseudoalteromonas luteoviolacea NCIMB 1942 TaxID=1365253 RepID=A0A167CUH5_9GAMM|nr:DUF2878 domain-containing protein [Pseudoalteromonas luteoviolacea]KZN48082.1 hypothetical protein N482_08780 [Pseudoalteromonas luteoviolacea NCIMB 1942]KZX01385.1 hypothetical protein JL49_06645 [Pseudoalteromonas luteoviolacea]
MMKRYSVIINFIVFQVAWFAVFFLNHQAVPVLLLVIGIMAMMSPDRKSDCMFVVCGLGVGLMIELIAAGTNVIKYVGGPIPVWLVLLWCTLLFSFRESMGKLFTLPLKIRVPLVWLGAPGSYYAGQQADLLITANPTLFFWLVYGGIWYCGFESLRWLNSHPKLKRKIGTDGVLGT